MGAGAARAAAARKAEAAARAATARARTAAERASAARAATARTAAARAEATRRAAARGVAARGAAGGRCAAPGGVRVLGDARARAGGLARAVGELLEGAVVERQAHIEERTCEGEQGHEKAAPEHTHVVCAHGARLQVLRCRATSANASEHAGVSARRAVRAGGRHAWAGSARRCRGGCSPAYTAVSGLDRAEGTACCSSNALAWILGRENFLAAEVKFRNELMHLKSSQKSASEGTTVNTGELKGLHTPRGADFRAESRWRAARARVQQRLLFRDLWAPATGKRPENICHLHNTVACEKTVTCVHPPFHALYPKATPGGIPGGPRRSPRRQFPPAPRAPPRICTKADGERRHARAPLVYR